MVWIRFYVNEPEVWVENKRKQRETKTEVKAPLLSIFKRGLLFNTLTACFWIASTFCVYYSIWALFSAYLQKELTEAESSQFSAEASIRAARRLLAQRGSLAIRYRVGNWGLNGRVPKACSGQLVTRKGRHAVGPACMRDSSF